MPFLLSVNVGDAVASDHTDIGVTGIDKRPVTVPVEVFAPGPKGIGGSGLVGDRVCDLRHHGGDDQAIYSYAREDLDWWARELDRPLSSGVFGENFTTAGIDITGALIGERWKIGSQVVLEVSIPRIPCRTFAGWLDQAGWVKTFTQRAMPGTYLRVVESGWVHAGDEITVVHHPCHRITVELAFRALTTRPELLPLLLANELPEKIRRKAKKRLGIGFDENDMKDPPANHNLERVVG